MSFKVPTQTSPRRTGGHYLFVHKFKEKKIPLLISYMFWYSLRFISLKCGIFISLNTFPYKTLHSSTSSLKWAVVYKLTHHRCALTHRAQTYRVWFKVTLAHGNIKAATATTNSIQLRQGIWVLTGWKWAELCVSYIKGKICKQRIWWYLAI